MITVDCKKKKRPPFRRKNKRLKSENLYKFCHIYINFLLLGKNNVYKSCKKMISKPFYLGSIYFDVKLFLKKIFFYFLVFDTNENFGQINNIFD